ncbi:AAA family ATPase [Bacillus litorisediminis]|uniref:AAA family ATPase n=1 Tax=Bacillus litorisediminis TaxID=2922713 RepID=UPI001FAED69C|nr:AAA family ATPase [Bacillus litorisediminis]
MIIKEIFIYQYGKWTDTHFRGLSPFILFQGENETGKSTISSFILSILFGFPTKRDDRFKASASSEYGGALLIECPTYGEFRIERNYGRKDVSVLFADGTVKDEEWLKKWLGGIDRGLYEHIYFFDLDGLQNVHKIHAEDITRYLLSASTIGSEKLFQVENELIKQQESIFKPQGRNPVLNQKLNTLVDLDTKVKEKKREMDQYDQLLQKKQQLIDKESNLKQELILLSKELEKEQAWFSTIPLVVKEKQLEEKIKEYETLSFPENGLERWKEWSHALKPLTAQEISLIDQLEQAESKLNMLGKPILLQDKSKIEALLEQSSLLSREEERKQQLQTKLKYLEEGLEENRQLLGISDLDKFYWDAASIKEAEIRLEKWQHLQTLFLEKENRYKLEKQRMKLTLDKLKQMQTEILSPQELELEEGMLIEWETIRSLENEKKTVQSEITLIEQENDKLNRKSNEHKKIESLLMGLVSAISLAGLAISIGQKQWLIALICFFLCVTAGVAFTFLKRNQSDHRAESNRYTVLKERLRQIEEKEKDFTCTEERYIEAREKIQVHHRIAEEIKELQTALKEQSWFVEQMDKECSEVQAQLQSVHMLLLELYQMNTGKNDVEIERLSYELPVIQSISQQIKEKNRIEDEIQVIEGRMRPIRRLLDDWAEKLQLSGSQLELFGLLKERLEAEKEQEQSRKYLQEGINDSKQQLKKLQAEKNLVKAELSLLLEKAGCMDEESYWKKGFQFAEKLKLQDQLAAIHNQLNLTRFSEAERLERTLDPDSCRSRIHELQTSQKAKTEELEYVSKQVATIEYQLKQMEEGGVYIDLLHQYHQEKHSFQQSAKAWSVLTIARGLLQEAMVHFKEGTLPKVLQHAESIFKTLTNENYEKIRFSSDKEELSVLHITGKWFPAGALSQATKEQLYVAIRFGLIAALYPTLSLPIIIDDSFVNFDPNRVAKVMETLKNFSSRHQVIVLSCHPEMAYYFSEDEIVELMNFQHKPVQ